jgi:hypothetical protein
MDASVHRDHAFQVYIVIRIPHRSGHQVQDGVGATDIALTGLHQTLNHFFAPFDRDVVLVSELGVALPLAASRKYGMKQGVLLPQCKIDSALAHNHVFYQLVSDQKFWVDYRYYRSLMMAVSGPSNLPGLEACQRSI